MNEKELGFLLLTSTLGDPARKPLTVAQFRTLAQRVSLMEKPTVQRQLEEGDLLALGYDSSSARRILTLFSQREQLDWYLQKGGKMDCVPITRVTAGYPVRVRKKLGMDSPGCLWAKGDISLLTQQKISVVGSRQLNPDNKMFAREAGRQAAMQGYVLVSGNAKGADMEAQNACLEQGGMVISVVADALEKHPLQRNVLYLSEESFDLAFTPQRALSRNRIIHSLGQLTLVAQCSSRKGGTWAGTVTNLRKDLSPVFCFADGSEAVTELIQLGAAGICMEQLGDFKALAADQMHLF